MDQRKHSKQLTMGSWREDSLQTLKMVEKQDDEETWGLEGGYSSDRGLSRHGENSSNESDGEQEDKGEDSDGENERSPPLFAGAKAGSSKTNSDDVLAISTKNTRKRKSTILSRTKKSHNRNLLYRECLLDLVPI